MDYRVMNFYMFFVVSKRGIMVMRLDATTGGGKGFFIEGFDKMVYTTLLIPLFYYFRY